MFCSLSVVTVKIVLLIFRRADPVSQALKFSDTETVSQIKFVREAERIL